MSIPSSAERVSGFSRETLESVLKRRFFYAPAFDIYGGVSGLYDYGPPGCSLQANIVDIWRKHFVLEDDMLEVDTTMLTPAEVLKTSGHVEKFADWMCKDLATGEIFRADHLVEEVLESRLAGNLAAQGKETVILNPEDAKKKKKKVKEIKAVRLNDDTVRTYEDILARIDGFSGPELGQIIEQQKIVNPGTGGPLTQPIEFNLMFETAIGPSGQLKGFLRPETAQGQFLNFNKLYEFNNLKMPFASASIGKSFRNEISPRSGLLRVREFLMAEIEHFVDPKDKNHPRFHEVEHTVLTFLPKDVQAAGKTDTTRATIGSAVLKGMVDNQTLGYFMVRIYLFLLKIGIDPERLRFRQHMANEMAHYASDCWDAELHTSYGWIECVGCADRSAYDLSVHAARTKEKMVVRQSLPEPIEVEYVDVEINKKKFGPIFKKDAPKVEQYLLSRSDSEKEELGAELAKSGSIQLNVPEISEPATVTSDLITISRKKRTEHIREYIPNVIEPSFGLGRILYSLMEHSFWARAEDKSRGVLSFPAIVAPTKALVAPISSNSQFEPIIKTLGLQLRKAGISSKIDDSSVSLGRRYARNDELGTPFGITVDFDTLKDGTVTLRDRDSTTQVRGSPDEVISAILKMVDDGLTWSEGVKGLRAFEGQSE